MTIRGLLLVILVTGVAGYPSPSEANHDNKYAFNAFREFPYYRYLRFASGGAASWQDEQWNGLQCPGGTDQDHANAMVTGLFAVGTGTTPDGSRVYFVQIGSEKARWLTANRQECKLQYRYFWETDKDGVFSSGLIEGYQAPSSHRFSLSFGSANCPGGLENCWHFNIDGSTVKFCCGGPNFYEAESVEWQSECIWHNSAVGCPSGEGFVTAQSLTVKVIGEGGTWDAWRGRDQVCIDYGKHARGKWNNAPDSAIGGFNTPLSGSTQGCVNGPGIP